MNLHTDELKTGDPKRKVLKDIFGFDDFRPGQEAAMDALLAGRNLLTVMPTGSGKSLCFQVPALVLGGLTVVVSPLVALMQDQVAALRLAGVAADSINSSQQRDDNIAAWRRAVAGETTLLYLAPERLMTERMLEALRKLDVRLIAVDEAHCISQWGPAFRPEYEALSRLRETQGNCYGWQYFGTFLKEPDVRCSACHYDWGGSAWLHFLRTGDERFSDEARVLTRHHADLDQYHVARINRTAEAHVANLREQGYAFARFTSRRLRLARHIESARLKNRLAQQHPRGDRRAGIMAFIKILVGPPGALRNQ